jgi:hypothetical protein
MPELTTVDGKPVDVAPVDPDAVNATFAAAMNDDGPDTQAPPKRQPRGESQGSSAPKPKRTRAPKAEQARTTTTPAGGALDDEARSRGVKGIAQITAGITLLLGKATGKDAFKADAVTIASAADDAAAACVETAHADPKFAAALDRVCAVGPYGAMITVAVGVGSQLARNHKPGLAIPGTVDPAELIRAQDDAEKQEPEKVNA